MADGFRHSGGHVTPECLSFFMGDGNAYLDCVLLRRGMHRTRTPISNAPVATEVGRNPSTAPKVDGLAPHRLVEKDVCEAFGNAAGSHGWTDRRHQSSVRFERPRPPSQFALFGNLSRIAATSPFPSHRPRLPPGSPSFRGSPNHFAKNTARPVFSLKSSQSIWTRPSASNINPPPCL